MQKISKRRILLTTMSMSSEDQIIPVVDNEDHIIGYKNRKDITHDDIYRVSACWVTDPEGNILLAQRARTKKHNPGKRGPAVAGTVAKGESYEENILHEIFEEIGVSVLTNDLRVGEKKFYNHDWQYFGQRFFLIYAGDKSLLKAEKGAVEQLRRHTPDELKTYLLTSPDEYGLSVHKAMETGGFFSSVARLGVKEAKDDICDDSQ